MDIKQEIAEFLDRLATFAAAVQKTLAWFLTLTGFASLLMAWQAYSPDASIAWNLLLCGLVLLPLLVWLLIWSLLSQLREAPEMVSDLAEDNGLSIASLRAHAANKKPGLISLFSTIRELRNNDAFETVTDAVGSITLLANPLFMIVAFIMLVLLFLLLIIAPFVVLF